MVIDSEHTFMSVFQCYHVHLFLLQKTNDNQQQVIKKRKKKDLSNLEKKPPKKNRVPKQG